MSLRTEIRSAIDEIAPPAPALPMTVRAFVFDAGRRDPIPQSATNHWRVPGRGFLSLVAAVLVIVLMAAVVVAGRVWRDSTTQSQAPLNQVRINKAELRSLEARSLQLASLPAGAECIGGPLSSVSSAHGGSPLTFGGGPVYATKGQRWVTTWGSWVNVHYLIDPKTAGLMLVRGRDLQTGESIVFGAYVPQSIKSSGALPVGNVQGTDYVISGTQRVDMHPELVLDPSVPTDLANTWPMWLGLVGYSKHSSGCIGFQIDGTDFTEVYVVNEAGL